jgi:hypothetical protein
MPNRKTFDERDKYDHSSHSTRNSEKGDLAPTPGAEAAAEVPPSERSSRTRVPRRRANRDRRS